MHCRLRYLDYVATGQRKREGQSFAPNTWYTQYLRHSIKKSQDGSNAFTVLLPATKRDTFQVSVGISRPKRDLCHYLCMQGVHIALTRGNCMELIDRY